VKEQSDELLIAEIRKRFSENENALHDLKVMMKKLEAVNEKLRQSEALKSNFLSNIRNEINNPLTAILGMSKHLANGAPEREAALLMAETIHREAFDLDFQLKNIFTAAEIEAGEATLSVSRTDVAALVRGLIASFSHKAEAKNLNVVFADERPGTGKELCVATDPEKLSFILSNLLANAIEFTREGTTIRITALKDGERALVSFADEGTGVSETDRERIFDRFSQLDAGAKKMHRGHGLGLSISKALAELLEGKLLFACAPEKGSVFTLNFGDLDAAKITGDFSEYGNECFFDDTTKAENRN
jgi:signal transduction histidine kinase